MKTAVVIPNWNGRDSIDGAIESLQNQTQKVNKFWDNDSAGDSVNYIRKNYLNVELNY